MTTAVNYAWRVEQPHGYWKHKLFSFTMMLVAGLLLLVAAPLIPVFMALIGHRARAVAERQLDEVGDINGFLLDRLAGLRTLRLLRAIDHTAGSGPVPLNSPA